MSNYLENLGYCCIMTGCDAASGGGGGGGNIAFPFAPPVFPPFWDVCILNFPFNDGGGGGGGGSTSLPFFPPALCARTLGSPFVHPFSNETMEALLIATIELNRDHTSICLSSDNLCHASFTLYSSKYTSRKNDK